MLIGNTFTYNGKSSEPYGLRFLIMNTDENKEIGGSLEYTTFKNNKKPNMIIQDTNYTSVFEYEVEIISENILDYDIDGIYDWLLNQPNFKKLYIDEENESHRFYYNCIFTNASNITVGGKDGWGIYGIRATMKCDSSFMWKDVKYTYTSTQLKNVVTHKNISNVREYIYPTLTIKIGTTGGDIALQNVSDNNRLTTFSDTLPNDTITLSYYPALVSSFLNDNDNLVYESFNKNFFRLLQGVNKIGIVGDISEITINYTIGRLVR